MLAGLVVFLVVPSGCLLVDLFGDRDHARSESVRLGSFAGATAIHFIRVQLHYVAF